MGTPSSPAIPVPRLHIRAIRSSPKVARVAVVGEIDLATAEQLRDRLLTVLHDQAPAVLDVDLAGASFMDCAGIGALVAVRTLALDAGRQLRVSQPVPIVRRTLELSGLLGVLTAPTDQPGQPAPESGHPVGTETDAATSMRPPDLVAATEPLPGMGADTWPPSRATRGVGEPTDATV